MTMKLCPRCRQRYSVFAWDVDYVHRCNSGDNTLDQEDVMKLGTYTDDSGNTIAVNRPFKQGQARIGLGTEGWIVGAREKRYTVRGANADTTRTRQHYEYIDEEK